MENDEARESSGLRVLFNVPIDLCVLNVSHYMNLWSSHEQQ